MFFENRGTPKSSILVRFSIINHPFWGTTIFGNTYFYMFRMRCLIVTLRIPTLQWKGNRHRRRDVKKPIKYITVEPMALFWGHFQFTRYSHERYNKHIPTVDGSKLRRSPVEVGSLYHYLQGFKTSQMVQPWPEFPLNIKRDHVDPWGRCRWRVWGPLVCLERALMDVMFMPVHGTSIPSCHRFLALWRCWLERLVGVWSYNPLPAK